MAITIAPRPATLDGCWQTWNEVDADATLRSEMEMGGFTKVRLRTTAAAWQVQASCVLPGALYEDFMAWFRVSCGRGVFPTRVKRPDGREVVVRFAQPPAVDWIQKDKGAFRVQAVLERMPAWEALEYDADAYLWFTNARGNGGTVSTATLAAMDAFVIAAKAAGYWPKLNRVNLFAGDQLAAALVPLKVGTGNPLDTGTGFVAGDYSEVTGLKGDGATKHLNTGLNCQTLVGNSTHMAAYNRSVVGEAGMNMGAVITAASQAMMFYGPSGTSASVIADQYGNSGGGRASVVIPAGAPAGFIVASRTSDTAHRLYRNGADIAGNATVSGTMPTNLFFVFAQANGAGSAPGGRSAGLCAGYSVGAGLTAADVAAYNAHIQAFQQALGRKV